jgi:ABC-type dipeptide/oligopeptide/nickel transport system permease component
MLKYVLRRLLLLPLILVVVSSIVFFALRLGGASPIDLVTETIRDPRDVQRIKQEWGLDRPLYVQYADFMVHAVQGDLGRSFISRQPVAKSVWERFPATIELSIAAMLLGATLGLVIGTLTAVRAGTWMDLGGRATALFGVSVPGFWLGLMLISLFAVKLDWLPVSGRFPQRFEFPTVTGFYLVDSLLAGNLSYLEITLRHLILPATVLASLITGFIARITRATVMEALRQDYIRTARSKGLREWGVIGRHAIRNALLPIVTILGLQFGNLLGGAAVTETVFTWPGLGKLMVDSIYVHDFPQVQASVILLATTYVVVNLVVDVLYAFIDPRIRYG